jgi:hypothetical protein
VFHYRFSLSHLCSLVQEWVDNVDFSDGAWCPEADCVFLYWAMYQDTKCQNVGRNLASWSPDALAKGFWDTSPDEKNFGIHSLLSQYLWLRKKGADGSYSVSSSFLEEGGTSQVNTFDVRSQGDDEDDLCFLTAAARGMNHAEEGSNLRLLSESQANLAGCSVASGLKDGTVKEEDLSEDVKSFLKRVENLQGSSYKNKQKNVIAVCTVCSFCGPIHPSSLIVFVGVCLPPGVNPYSMLFMVVCNIFSLRLIVKITSGGENNFTSGGDFP